MQKHKVQILHFSEKNKCKYCTFRLTKSANLDMLVFKRGDIMNLTLKQLRQKNKLTQAQSAEFLKVSLRTYKTYENDETKKGTIKYNYMVQKLEQLTYIDETHGILSREDIIGGCRKVLKKYPITYCYLFGSYAKGTAGEASDVDLLVSPELQGLKFYGLVENIKNELQKNVDVLSSDQLVNNRELLDEILKDGIKIYG